MRMGENGAHGSTRLPHALMNGRRPQPRKDGPRTGSVRIIGGRWRGSRLQVPERPGLRPSADRVRETLFNWLQQELPGAQVLDLFAGTGVLGLEALSRGAGFAQFVEADPGLAQALADAASRLGAGGQAAVHRGDALAWLQSANAEPFDIAFVDPPFAGGFWDAVLAGLPRLMADHGWLYVESPVGHASVLPAEWRLHREGATREVRYALYRRVTLAPIQAATNP